MRNLSAMRLGEVDSADILVCRQSFCNGIRAAVSLPSVAFIHTPPLRCHPASHINLGSILWRLEIRRTPRFCLCAALPLSNTLVTHDANHDALSAVMRSSPLFRTASTVLLAALALPSAVYSFSFTFSNPVACEDLEIQWTGGSSPRLDSVGATGLLSFDTIRNNARWHTPFPILDYPSK